jgi:P-type E1-E2 ATPase
MQVDIPGYGTLTIEHIVFDFNGTLAMDGRLIDGVGLLLEALPAELTLHVLTADTFGTARTQIKGVNRPGLVFYNRGTPAEKLAYVRDLDASRVAAIGNGRNDGAMLEAAALGVVAINAEGAAVETLLKADIVCTSIIDALNLFLEPRRIIATLRS